MTESPNPQPPNCTSKVMVWLLGIIAFCLLAIVGIAVSAYLSLRSAANRIEKQADIIETRARDIAGRATSATKAGFVAAADKLGDARDTLSSATRDTLSSAGEKYDQTKDKITSATASATSRTKALIALPGEKWSQWRDGETSAVTSETNTPGEETSGRLERNRQRGLKTGASGSEDDSAKPKTSSTLQRLRSRVLN